LEIVYVALSTPGMPPEVTGLDTALLERDETQ